MSVRKHAKRKAMRVKRSKATCPKWSKKEKARLEKLLSPIFSEITGKKAKVEIVG